MVEKKGTVRGKTAATKPAETPVAGEVEEAVVATPETDGETPVGNGNVTPTTDPVEQTASVADDVTPETVVDAAPEPEATDAAPAEDDAEPVLPTSLEGEPEPEDTSDQDPGDDFDGDVPQDADIEIQDHSDTVAGPEGSDTETEGGAA